MMRWSKKAIRYQNKLNISERSRKAEEKKNMASEMLAEESLARFRVVAEYWVQLVKETTTKNARNMGGVSQKLGPH
jgi:hypothetical protein